MRRNHPAAIERDRAIIDAYRAGGSLRSIADDFRISHQAVSNTLAAYDVPRRAAGRPVIDRPDITTAEIIRRRAAGQSFGAIARAMGVSIPAIRFALASAPGDQIRKELA